MLIGELTYEAKNNWLTRNYSQLILTYCITHIISNYFSWPSPSCQFLTKNVPTAVVLTSLDRVAIPANRVADVGSCQQTALRLECFESDLSSTTASQVLCCNPKTNMS